MTTTSSPALAGRLHFGQMRSVSAKEVNRDEDSGNGYYSYSYTLIPFTGTIDSDEKRRRVYQALYARFRGAFVSLGTWEVCSTTPEGGTILLQTIYHHGD